MSLANPPVYDGDSEPFILELIDWFTASAGDRYSESVSQLEHALQCAHLAEDESASQTEIVAALLHDVGHILMLKQRLEGKGDSRDLRHEHVGATWLERVFPKSVCEPIRLHVPAKRYLCATDPGYWDTLSPGSKRSLQLQGGPLDDEEVTAFEQLEFWREAVALRQRDERGKRNGWEVPPMSHYRTALLACVAPSR